MRHGLLALMFGFAMSTQVVAQSSPARIENVSKAAADIARLQTAQGFNGTFPAVLACYDRALKAAVSITLPVEYCIVQDMIVAQGAAGIYAMLSPEARKKAGYPDPDELKTAMAQRIANIYRKFRADPNDGRALLALVNTHGLKAYGDALAEDRKSPTQNKKN
jgi:hypothetical protein